MIELTHYTIGRSGFIAADAKREGDGCTPLGTFPLREIWFRPDRVAQPETMLPVREITPDDCWCDEPEHPLYNKHFALSQIKNPPASFERLWRDDGAYDVIIVIGYNDAPVIAGKGSAIFIHCNHDDGRPTAGCVALEKNELITLMTKLNPSACIEISEEIVRFLTSDV